VNASDQPFSKNATSAWLTKVVAKPVFEWMSIAGPIMKETLSKSTPDAMLEA
jgi:hypothetical protein